MTFNFDTPGLTGAREIDAYFEELLKSNEVASPEPGANAEGYRVYYEYKDKLYPPIVGTPKDKQGVKQYALVSYIAEHPGTKIQDKEFVRGMAKNIPYGEDTGAGYYYWPTKELAIQFMHILAQDFGRLDKGPQNTYVAFNDDGKIFSTISRPHSKYRSEKIQGFGQLGVYKVQGTAGRNVRGDGGFVMSDIFIPEQEPVETIDVGSAYTPDPPLDVWDEDPVFE